MITLEVEEMCHECPNFKAVSETSVLYGDIYITARGNITNLTVTRVKVN